MRHCAPSVVSFMHQTELLFVFPIGFDAEEDGSYGSQEFLNKIIVPNFIRQGVNIQVDFLNPLC